MKCFSKFTFSLLFTLAPSSFAFADWVDIPAIVGAPIEQVFAPVGFDNNDNVEVIVRGLFPSTCYSVGPVSARIDEGQKKIVVKAESILHIGSPCAQFKVPFIQSVKLGLLEPANYSVFVEGSSAPAALLPVKRALVETVDDYLYANVQTISVATSGQGLQTITLKGTHPVPGGESCIVMKEVKVNPIENGVLVVQPITEVVSGQACHTSAANPYFSTTVTLQSQVARGSLVHVRTLHGDSLNYLLR